LIAKGTRIVPFDFPCTSLEMQADRVYRIQREASCRTDLAAQSFQNQEEDGTAKHAEDAKDDGALQVQDDAFDLQARPAEVEQQA
jgi:hypothetical protein